MNAFADIPEPVVRDRWGRPVIYGVPHTRATTVAGTLDDRHNLELWIMRNVAIGLALRPDLMALVQAMDLEAVQQSPDLKKQMNKLLDSATEAAGSLKAANLGTALHAMTEKLDLNPHPTSIVFPDEFRPHLEAYARVTANVEWTHVEQLLVLEEYTVAGTPDRIGPWGSSQLPTVWDLKTGSSIDLAMKAIAVQLAIYAHADYAWVDGKAVDLPPLNQQEAIVIHLPVDNPGVCNLYTVDIERGWEAFKQSVWAREWRGAKGLHQMVAPDGTPVEVSKPSKKAKAKSTGAGPADDKRQKEVAGTLVASRALQWEWLYERIRIIGNDPEARETLLRAWPTGIAKPSELSTDDDLAQIASTLDRVEANHGIPFGETDPRAETPAPRKR